jgi:hypothetical protein
MRLLVSNAGIAKDDNTMYSNGKPDLKVMKAPEFLNLMANLSA